MKKKYILIVEDDRNDLEFTIKALKEIIGSNDLFSVNDGVEALDFLKSTGKFSGREKTNPALVILDKKMPRMDGIEVVKKIKNDRTLKKIPVVVFSSSNYEQDIIDSYESGANAYVVKPINIDDFLSTVRMIGLFWLRFNELPPFEI